MGRLATGADFEGRRHGTTVRGLRAGDGALEAPRPTWLYDDYRRFPFFAERAAWIKTHYPKARTVLVAGCGYGFLVEALLERKVDAWGFDASSYAIGKAREHLPERRFNRVFLLDAGAGDQVIGVARMAGVDHFDLVVSEDLLPCADDDAEARLWLDNLRAVGKQVLHICTPMSPASVDNGLLWKTHGEWAAFCAPDPVLCAECWGVAQERRP